MLGIFITSQYIFSFGTNPVINPRITCNLYPNNWYFMLEIQSFKEIINYSSENFSEKNMCLYKKKSRNIKHLATRLITAPSS